MKKLLAIVDDWERLERIEDYYRSEFEVHCVPFGSLGVLTAIQEKPDFILIDLEFEDMSEKEVLPLIRAEDSLRNVPIVVIMGTWDLQESSQELWGKVKILVRPVPIDSLPDFKEEDFSSGNPPRAKSQKSE
jgi:DNA-binding response OmpR family regulator